jgi:hypothetical protein
LARLTKEFTTRLLAADAGGSPAVLLGDIPDDGERDHFDCDGVTLTRRSSSLIFGDAGTVKSYWALYQLGQLAARGVRVALVDFELDGLPHQRRWQALWPVQPPAIHYVHCTRPLVQDLDSLRRLVLDAQIEPIRIHNDPTPKWMAQTRPGGLIVGLKQSGTSPTRHRDSYRLQKLASPAGLNG